MDYLVRFLIGGTVVSIFAVLGDVLRPKSFAGLFGAAPSVALATLGLTFWKESTEYVAIEGRSMMIGALALALYSLVVCQLLMRARLSSVLSTGAATVLWLTVAIGAEYMLFG
jgi:hypothetical protein